MTAISILLAIIPEQQEDNLQATRCPILLVAARARVVIVMLAPFCSLVSSVPRYAKMVLPAQQQDSDYRFPHVALVLHPPAHNSVFRFAEISGGFQSPARIVPKLRKANPQSCRNLALKKTLDAKPYPRI